MTYRIVQRGLYFVPQEKIGEVWADFVSGDPNNPVAAPMTLAAARTLAVAGPVSIPGDIVVEEE